MTYIVIAVLVWIALVAFQIYLNLKQPEAFTDEDGSTVIAVMLNMLLLLFTVIIAATWPIMLVLTAVSLFFYMLVKYANRNK